ncbi:hypothetical protein [Microbacterium sp.]|uniref:hypothetical protein n=1 Tax=Microbacterium sp. TaxID=51671 RepID=UPI003F6ED74E
MSIAERLLACAVADGQCAHGIQPSDDVSEIRAEIRRLAKAKGIRIRTGIVDASILAVATADSALWHDSVPVMRAKLTP